MKYVIATLWVIYNLKKHPLVLTNVTWDVILATFIAWLFDWDIKIHLFFKAMISLQKCEFISRCPC